MMEEEEKSSCKSTCRVQAKKHFLPCLTKINGDEDEEK
jgi:hypothetical protein